MSAVRAFLHGRPLQVRRPTAAEAALGAEEVFERDGHLVFSVNLGLELKCTCKQAGCEHRRDVREYMAMRKLRQSDLKPCAGGF